MFTKNKVGKFVAHLVFYMNVVIQIYTKNERLIPGPQAAVDKRDPTKLGQASSLLQKVIFRGAHNAAG